MSQHGVMGRCAHSLPGGDALERQVGQLERRGEKGTSYQITLLGGISGEMVINNCDEYE